MGDSIFHLHELGRCEEGGRGDEGDVAATERRQEDQPQGEGRAHLVEEERGIYSPFSLPFL